MIPNFLLSPPVALIVVLAFGTTCYAVIRPLTFKKSGPPSEGLRKPYACGEEQTENVQADYAQFFPFAFFFTILHVVALTVTTVPAETAGNFLIAILYVVCALVGLSVLYRSQP